MEERNVALKAKARLESEGIEALSFFDLAAINSFDDLATAATLERQAALFDRLRASQ